MQREDYIKKLIKDKNLTIKEFAKEIEIPYSTLLSMLNGSLGGASVDSVIKICKHLNIAVEELNNMTTNYGVDGADIETKAKLIEDDKVSNLSEIHRKVISMLEELTPEQTNAVLAFLNSLEKVEMSLKR